MHSSIHPSIYSSIHSSIYSTIYSFIHPSIQPSIHPSILPSTSHLGLACASGSRDELELCESTEEQEQQAQTVVNNRVHNAIKNCKCGSAKKIVAQS
jgi:hypothetical protein